MASLLKYVEEAKPWKRHPPKQNVNENRRLYESNKIIRKSYRHWTVGREWFYYSQDENVIKCKPCAKFYTWKKVNKLKDNAKVWVSGNGNIKIDCIKLHETSVLRSNAVKAVANSKKMFWSLQHLFLNCSWTCQHVIFHDD